MTVKLRTLKWALKCHVPTYMTRQHKHLQIDASIWLNDAVCRTKCERVIQIPIFSLIGNNVLTAKDDIILVFYQLPSVTCKQQRNGISGNAWIIPGAAAHEAIFAKPFHIM